VVRSEKLDVVVGVVTTVVVGTHGGSPAPLARSSLTTVAGIAT
jgi:hypothetical protein